MRTKSHHLQTRLDRHRPVLHAFRSLEHAQQDVGEDVGVLALPVRFRDPVVKPGSGKSADRCARMDDQHALEGHVELSSLEVSEGDLMRDRVGHVLGFVHLVELVRLGEKLRGDGQGSSGGQPRHTNRTEAHLDDNLAVIDFRLVRQSGSSRAFASHFLRPPPRLLEPLSPLDRARCCEVIVVPCMLEDVKRHEARRVGDCRRRRRRPVHATDGRETSRHRRRLRRGQPDAVPDGEGDEVAEESVLLRQPAPELEGVDADGPGFGREAEEERDVLVQLCDGARGFAEIKVELADLRRKLH